MDKWLKQKQHKLFEGNILSLNRLECHNSKKRINHSFFTLESPDWITIVALTEDEKFILVRQHRLGNDQITLETPGGLVESNESPQDSAVRELREETGYEAGRIYLLKKLYVNPAIFNNFIYFFYAGNCKKINEQALDISEDIDVIILSRDEIVELIINNGIDHSVVITALYLFFFSKWCGWKDNFIKRLLL